MLAVNKDGKLSSQEPFQPFYYPNVSERAKAAIISIGPGETVKDLDVVVSKLEETITVQGVLQYSDGKPVPDEWLKFDASDTANTDGDVSDKTDADGRFSLKILKGLKGELSSDMYVRIGEFENCPKLDELIRKTGRDHALVKTTPLSIEAERNLYDIELTFPFSFCKKKE